MPSASSPISGSVKYRLLTRARGRCECCGAHEHQRPLEVDNIIPRNQGGSDAISNFCALEGSGRVLLENELALCIAAAYPVSEGHSLVIPRWHRSTRPHRWGRRRGEGGGSAGGQGCGADHLSVPPLDEVQALPCLSI